MVFSSSLFLVCFLPVFLAAYLVTPRSLRNWTALVGSVLFYAWGAPLFVFLVLVSIVLDFMLVRTMHRSDSPKHWVTASIVLNIGLLAYFKYANFLVGNLNDLLSSIGIRELGWTAVALPIGISFFTFQKLSYTLDVYRGKHSSLNRLHDYALYIILFPQLIAGPIVRFNEIADQLMDRKQRENVDHRLLGFFRFSIGLAKKVLVANTMAGVADHAFSLSADELHFGWAWSGLLAYAIQIYFDFSGYSDMAIGLGRMMGFVFPENFRNPYIAASITEFWRRWHITLSNWMRDYLYIPLGGNRKGTARTYLNLWTVFLLSGLWHGASWTFVFWGAYHGLFLVMERLFLLRFYQRIGRLPSMVLTFFAAVLGWVLFRSDSAAHAWIYYRTLFTIPDVIHGIWWTDEFWYTLYFGLAASFIGFIPWVEKWQERLLSKTDLGIPITIARTVTAMLLFIFCLSMIVASDFNPFIYFRF